MKSVFPPASFPIGLAIELEKDGLEPRMSLARRTAVGTRCSLIAPLLKLESVGEEEVEERGE
jgi:hypothetical protein